jgi:hypothetical protein
MLAVKHNAGGFAPFCALDSGAEASGGSISLHSAVSGAGPATSVGYSQITAKLGPKMQIATSTGSPDATGTHRRRVVDPTSSPQHMETLRWYSSRLEWPDLSHSAALQAPIAYLPEPCLAQMTNVAHEGLLVEAGVPLQLIVAHPVARLAEL